ncbi:MAG: cold-shock protein [Pseudomonadota bacterium]
MKTWQDSRLTAFIITLGLAVIGALAIGQIYDYIDQRLLQFFTSAAVILIISLLAGWLAPPSAKPGLRPKEVAVEHEPVRETGKVKWFNVDKGFGFIIRDNGEDLFVHFRAISDGGASRLNEGQQVEYQIGQGRKGPQAEEVVILD